MNQITQSDHHTMPAAVMLSPQETHDDATIAQQRFLILVAQLIATYETQFDGDHEIYIHSDDINSVVLLEPDSKVVRVFTDIGLPHQDDRLAVYEAALHYDLPIGFQSVSIGLHPVSSRLIATGALPALMPGDICGKTEQLLQITRECAKKFRTRFATFESESSK